jgi:hypothetical protein
MTELGDTSFGAWMMEFVTACAREVDGKDVFDFNMVYRMTQSEPKRADKVIQIFAQDLRQELDGQPVESATSSTATKVMFVGLMAMSFEIQGKKAGAPLARPDGFTERLDRLMRLHPVIYDCFTYTSTLFPAK